MGEGAWFCTLLIGGDGRKATMVFMAELVAKAERRMGMVLCKVRRIRDRE